MDAQQTIFNTLLHELLGKVSDLTVKSIDGDLIISKKSTFNIVNLTILNSYITLTHNHRSNFMSVSSYLTFDNFENLNIEEITKSFIDFTNK